MKPLARLTLITTLALLIGLVVLHAHAAPTSARHAPGSLVRFMHLSLAGATGYLMKNVSARELADAIRAAHKGKMTLSPEAAQALAHAAAQKNDGAELTDREREVLKLMVEGLNNAEIAERLVVSLSTVKYHISNILSKLQVDNRVAAVTMAIQKKLV
jgi:two-component system, NarL family, response regulator LiaR